MPLQIIGLLHLKADKRYYQENTVLRTTLDIPPPPLSCDLFRSSPLPLFWFHLAGYLR